jgi:hypothetical protein
MYLVSIAICLYPFCIQLMRIAVILDLYTCCINDAQELRCVQCSANSLLVASKP